MGVENLYADCIIIMDWEYLVGGKLRGNPGLFAFKGTLLIHSPLVYLWEFIRVCLRVFNPNEVIMAAAMTLDMTIYVLYNMTYKQT
ncbi:MAG: hypothetical protein DRI97_12270 [Bacteroidetes bacterium]|nr:MAG: hypothetical protein DRI97_12270 [Bacteroidota bacterium]